MTRDDKARRWYLFDYGNVISTAPTQQDWDLLAEATGTGNLREPASPYWAHRSAYDAGSLTSDGYWSLVAGVRVGPVRSAWLDVLDGNQWSHPNLEVLDVLEDLDARGERLALLATMPAAMIAHHAHSPWTRLFRHLFFSADLRLVQPSEELFRHVLAALEVEPERVTYVDDVPGNVRAARSLGLDALLFEPASDLSRMLAQDGAARAAGTYAGGATSDRAARVSAAVRG